MVTGRLLASYVQEVVITVKSSSTILQEVLTSIAVIQQYLLVVHYGKA